MESLILSEIPYLNSVYSDAKYLYIPEFDQRVTLSAVLSTLHQEKININSNGITVSGQQQFSIINLPFLEKIFANSELITKEVLIDGGNYQVNEKRNHLCDYIFAFGQIYAQRILWYKEKYQLPISISNQTVIGTVLIDKSGYYISNDCNLHDKCFLHPASMGEQCEIVQFFIPLFNKRYNTSFKFVGDVYEDEYFSTPFIDTTDATYGQVFLLGVSWALNRKQIEAGIPCSREAAQKPQKTAKTTRTLARGSNLVPLIRRVPTRHNQNNRVEPERYRRGVGTPRQRWIRFI